jgi:hypothetical protein
VDSEVILNIKHLIQSFIDFDNYFDSTTDINIKRTLLKNIVEKVVHDDIKKNFDVNFFCLDNMQLDSSSKCYKNSLKKLSKHIIECNVLAKIINHIKVQDSYEDLKNNTMSKIYGFEELKGNLNGYCSFNLSKNGGVIRLICSLQMIDDNKTIQVLKLNIISFDHYKDLKDKEF